MKDKESGYPLSFILTEWEYAGDWRWSWAVRPPAGTFLSFFLSSAKESDPPEADTPI